MGLLISSCSTFKKKVNIPDLELCGDLGSDGATCFHTLTTETRDVPKSAWDVERFGQICESPESWAKVKLTIEKLCSAYKKCTYEDIKNLNNFFYRIEHLEDSK